MPLDAEVEMPQFIVRQTISSQLHGQCVRTVLGHNRLHNRFKQRHKFIVSDARFQRYIQRIMFPVVFANFVQPARPREEILAVLVERHRHAAVRQVESLLYSVAVVDVDIEVQHSRVDLQQF